MSYVPKITTVQLDRSVVKELKKAKKYQRQTYSELISDLLKAYKANMRQYDEYLHRIQQERMKDLWDNKEDEAWENA